MIKGFIKACRNRSRFLLILSTVFIVASGMRIGVFAFDLISQGDFWLEAENQGADNYIFLEWEDLGNDVFYTIYQSDDKMVTWETRSANYGKEIKVLNVYPNVSGSDLLKEWMDANGGGEDGTGRITVTKESISTFSAEPDKYLFDENGEYAYDVVAFGFWDSNNGLDLSNAAKLAVEEYIKSGYGVLFGHDTVRAGMANFAELGRSYLNMDIENPLSSIPMLGGTTIHSINDGFLLRYPWKIEHDKDFEVPMSHSNGQVAYGTNWMNYTRPFTYSYPPYSGDETIRGSGTSNFYLTTWNNTAAIQTGHSRGESTETEQKILANVLMYLAQYTEGTTAEDQSGIDLAAPEIPEAVWGGGVKEVQISAEDLGTGYHYKIEATDKHNNSVKTSDIVYEECLTGIKGYYIIEDAGSYLDFNVELLTLQPAEADGTFSYTMTDLNNYIHVKAVDHAGNVSRPARISPYDFDWELEVTKQLDSEADRNQNFVFLLEQRLETAGPVINTYYGVVTIPTGASSETITFGNIQPGIYTVTEQDTNWTYQLNVSSSGHYQLILADSENPRGEAEFKNDELETAWINNRGDVRNRMRLLTN